VQPRGETVNGERTEGPPRPSLRERKKAKTRAAIQRHALRLFGTQGYEATTVEQIADAAEVAPSTLYRYFPSKADILLRDELDEALADGFRAQPAGMSALQALRATLRAAFATLPPEEAELLRQRAALARQVPELRAVMLDEVVRSLHTTIRLVAERTGRPTDDVAVRTLAGAVLGVSVAAWLTAGEDSFPAYLAMTDQGLALLGEGLRF